MPTSLVMELCDAQHQSQLFTYFSNMAKRGTKVVFILENIWVNQSQQLSHYQIVQFLFMLVLQCLCACQLLCCPREALGWITQEKITMATRMQGHFNILSPTASHNSMQEIHAGTILLRGGCLSSTTRVWKEKKSPPFKIIGSIVSFLILSFVGKRYQVTFFFVHWTSIFQTEHLNFMSPKSFWSQLSNLKQIWLITERVIVFNLTSKLLFWNYQLPILTLKNKIKCLTLSVSLFPSGRRRTKRFSACSWCFLVGSSAKEMGKYINFGMILHFPQWHYWTWNYIINLTEKLWEIQMMTMG